MGFLIEPVATRIRAALAHLPERLIPAPDCGMKYIPRDLAFTKLEALAAGAAIVRRELTGGSAANFGSAYLDDAFPSRHECLYRSQQR